MTTTLAAAPMADERTLVLDRHLAAPRAALWRCWTEPELLVRWFTPAPWRTASAELDLRPGGASRVVMLSPEGQSFPNAGVYLAVEPGRRLVFTDAFTEAWIPSAKPFFVGEISFADEGEGTRYIATARHWTKEDRAEHEAMGFHAGWGKAADQLEALAQTL
jgi:uncharacterized protein YndB with AHSA1/START domain